MAFKPRAFLSIFFSFVFSSPLPLLYSGDAVSLTSLGSSPSADVLVFFGLAASGLLLFSAGAGLVASVVAACAFAVSGEPSVGDWAPAAESASVSSSASSSP